MPRSTVEFLGNWNVLGLRGTGSYDFRVPEQIIHEDFVLNPGSAQVRRGGPLYRMGFLALPCLTHAAFALGCARRALDEFQPDFCVIWGDDQFENHRDDCVPAFSVLAYDEVTAQPWLDNRRGVNSWNEPKEKTFTMRGHRAGGKHIAAALLNEGFDIAYAYRPLHHNLGHAFLYSVLYLDWDRKGFDLPIVPFTVNAYGRHLTGSQGIPPTPTVGRRLEDSEDDPPGPQPWRCFQIGAATARALGASPWRVALIASSSWSHSFLTAKHGRMYPDVESDKRYYEALRAGDWETWRNTTLDQVEDRGHHELLNWFCLAGAMHALGNRKPNESIFLESWISNSDKVFAVFRPDGR